LGAALGILRDADMRYHDDGTAKRLPDAVASLDSGSYRVLVAVVAAAGPQHPSPGVENDQDVILLLKLREEHVRAKPLRWLHSREVDRVVDQIELTRIHSDLDEVLAALELRPELRFVFLAERPHPFKVATDSAFGDDVGDVALFGFQPMEF